MDLIEFESKKDILFCGACGSPGLVTIHNPNNNSISPFCPSCSSTKPLADVMYLKQNGNRKPPRPRNDPTTTEVWNVCGNTCAFCGITRDECELIGMGMTKQHIVPFCSGGADSYLIPFCARCQQASLAAFEAIRLWRNYIEKKKVADGTD